jgi:hypothetical protein
MSNKGKPIIIGVTKPAATNKTVIINVTIPETINAFSVAYIFKPVNVIINTAKIMNPPNHCDVIAFAFIIELNMSVGAVIE